MGRIGVQTWGTQGDVQPFLALAAALGRRGHEVELVMATAADAHYEAPQGVTITRVEGGVTRAQMAALVQEVAAIKAPLAQAKAMMTLAFEPYIEALSSHARRLAQGSSLIVRHHFLFMAQAEAMRAQVPEVSVFLTPDLIPTRAYAPTGMPSFGPLQGLAWWMMAKGAGQVFMPPAASYRAAHKLPPPRHLMRDVWSSADANIIAVSPTLCPRPEDWARRYHMTGFLNGPMNVQGELDPELEAFINAQPQSPPLYATFGSMAPSDQEGLDVMVALFLEAAKRLGRRVIIEAPLTREVPAYAQLVRQSPHARVFPRCAAVIHHGGAGTTQTALKAGKPSVIVPHMADQFFWGAQLERLGAGVATKARHKLSVDGLVVALGRVLDDAQIEARVAELGGALGAEDGVGQAVEVIERALG